MAADMHVRIPLRVNEQGAVRLRVSDDPPTTFSRSEYVEQRVVATDDYSELPTVTAADNGKVLGVVGGAWAATSGGGGGGSAWTDLPYTFLDALNAEPESFNVQTGCAGNGLVILSGSISGSASVHVSAADCGQYVPYGDGAYYGSIAPDGHGYQIYIMRDAANGGLLMNSYVDDGFGTMFTLIYPYNAS